MVARVYPQNSKAYGASAESSEEDGRRARSVGRVGAVWVEPGHTSREAQKDVGQTLLLGNRAVADGLSQGQKCGSSSKEGDKYGFEIQNN